jgi:hypothetical protein
MPRWDDPSQLLLFAVGNRHPRRPHWARRWTGKRGQLQAALVPIRPTTVRRKRSKPGVKRMTLQELFNSDDSRNLTVADLAQLRHEIKTRIGGELSLPPAGIEGTWPVRVVRHEVTGIFSAAGVAFRNGVLTNHVGVIIH